MIETSYRYMFFWTVLQLIQLGLSRHLTELAIHHWDPRILALVLDQLWRALGCLKAPQYNMFVSLNLDAILSDGQYLSSMAMLLVLICRQVGTLTASLVGCHRVILSSFLCSALIGLYSLSKT